MGIRLSTAQSLLCVGAGDTYISYAVSLATLEDKMDLFPSGPWWDALKGVLPEMVEATVKSPDQPVSPPHQVWLAALSTELTQLPSGHIVVQALRANT